MRTDDLTIQPLAQSLPPRSATGLFLRYDHDLAIFVLVDKAQEDADKRVVELGPLSSTKLRLVEIYGLSDGQANEAIGRSRFGFGDLIDLGWVVRTAATQQMGTPEQAPIYINGIPDSAIRSYGMALLGHFTGQRPRPVLPEDLGPADAQNIVSVLRSFGIHDPAAIDVDAPAVLGEAMQRLGSAEALHDPQDLDAIVRIAESVRDEAQIIAGLVRREIPEMRASLELLPDESRRGLASEFTAVQRLMAAISSRIREGFSL